MITVNQYDTKYHRLTQTGNLKTPIKIKRKRLSQDDLGDVENIYDTVLTSRMGISHSSSKTEKSDKGKQDSNVFDAFIRNPGIDIRPEDIIEVINSSDSFEIISVIEYNNFIVFELERKFKR